MKNIYLFAKAGLLAMALAFMPSCSDDEEALAPVFPENSQTITCNPGETQTLSFEANMDWTVTSTASTWCKFVSGESTVNSLSGTEGSQTITITTTEDAWDFVETTAQIELSMGGQKQVIAEVKRGPRAYELTVFVDSEHTSVNTPENPVSIVYSRIQPEANAYIQANFDWKLGEVPAWLSISEIYMQGEASSEATLVVLSLNQAYSRDAQTASIPVLSSDDVQRGTLEVRYDGMPENAIEVTSNLSGEYNWTVSADGATYWQESMGSMGDEETEPTVYSFADTKPTFNVQSKNNAYTVLTMYKSNNFMMADESAFYDVTDDRNGNVTLTAFDENSGSRRNGYLLILPNVYYDAISSNIENTLYNEAGDDINGGYVVKNAAGNWIRITEEAAGEEDFDLTIYSEYFKLTDYVVMAFSQEAGASSETPSMEITYQEGGTGSVTVNLGLGEQASQTLQNKIMGGDIYIMNNNPETNDKIYNITVPKNSVLNINPLLADDWGELPFTSIQLMNPDGNVFGTGVTPPETFVENNVLTIGCSMSCFIMFKSDNGMAYKGLLINVTE